MSFKIKGHATASDADENGRLVCSAISSAAYMAANTITEVIGAKAQVEVCEANMFLKILSRIEDCQIVVKGLKLHLEQLSQQYDNYLTVVTEV